jgi:hypothetical protein
MWNRACPLCFANVPRSLVLTRGDGLICPSCHTALELSRPSRILAASAGLFAALLAAPNLFGVSQALPWVMPILGAVLGYGAVSALVLFFLADLVVQPNPPAVHHTHAKP